MEQTALPEYLHKPSEEMQKGLVQIRARRLRTRDLTAALEELFSLVVKEYVGHGGVLNEETLNGEIVDLAVALAIQSDLDKTNPGPYKGPSAMFRGGVPVATRSTGADFDFRIRLRRKVDESVAQLLEGSCGRLPGREPHREAEPSQRDHWLERELRLRGWSTLDLQNAGGPERRTSAKYIRGEKIINAALKKIVDALNSHVPKGSSEININNLPS